MTTQNLHHITVAALTGAIACFGGYLYYNNEKKKKVNVNKKLHDILQIFRHENVAIKDLAKFRDKIRRLISAGSQSLQVLTDFDKTLTKNFVDGQKGDASYGVIDNSKYLPSFVTRELTQLHSKYFPIEMDTTISESEKIPLMIEWYTAAFNMAAKAGIKRNMIPIMVRDSTVELRDGSDVFFHTLEASNVPLLIASAGLGDIISEALRQQASVKNNVHLIANFYEFDRQDVVKGLKGKMIHTFNKGEISKNHSEYFEKQKERRHVIVMGDTLGDPQMANGLDVDNVLKVGFLNDKVNESLPAYLEVFDVVFTHDVSLDLMNAFLHTLLRQ